MGFSVHSAILKGPYGVNNKMPNNEDDYDHVILFCLKAYSLRTISRDKYFHLHFLNK